MRIISVSPDESVVLKAGRLFDGHSLVPGENINIYISGGIIREVRPLPREIQPQYGFLAYDLTEFTVMPGMVDCHLHLALDGRDFNKSLELWRQEELLKQRIRKDLAGILESGIVAVRDGGDREGIGLSVRDQTARRTTPAPLIRASGTALGKAGKYGAFLGPGFRGQFGDAVKDLSGRGVDQVKVLVSGVVSFTHYRRVGSLQFSQDELDEIVESAHDRGIRVMAHASSDEAVSLSLRAGVDSIEHGYFVSDQSLENMARADIPWVPTLAPVANQLREELRSRYSPEEREVIRRTLARQQEMVGRASEKGIRIGVGTDSGATGVLHGKGFLDELLLLEEAGLARSRVLRAATVEGSSILGLENEMGTVRPGMKPYLVAVRGNPLENLRDLDNIDYIFLPSGG